MEKRTKIMAPPARDFSGGRRQITFHAEAPAHKEIFIAAAARGISVSEFCRQAVEARVLQERDEIAKYLASFKRMEQKHEN